MKLNYSSIKIKGKKNHKETVDAPYPTTEGIELPP